MTKKPYFTQFDLDVFNFIVDYKLLNGGCSPALEEIADGVGKPGNKSHVRFTIDKFERIGLMSHIQTLSRSLMVEGLVCTLRPEYSLQKPKARLNNLKLVWLEKEYEL